ncbi:MAG: sulfite exporter TauE/SafE family protein [Gemmatimonadales bacterium]|nr:sulfite exporter TauE/SafE family protein [Gemmatimonadales bacterium]
MKPLLVLGIAFGASLLGSMSGGSSSALTTPAWLAMGVPLPTAVATDKVAGALWTLLGARNCLRRRTVDWPLIVGMAALGLAGAWFGTDITVRLDPEVLKRGVGAAILMLIAVMLARPVLGREPGPARLSRPVVAAAAVPLGLYEGMLGSGNSLIATLLFCTGRGYDLIAALGHYYLLAFAWCALAAAAYISRGYYDVALMIPATIGSCAGGFLGSRIASERGTAFVRGLFVLSGTALGVKLLMGW